MIDWEQYQQTLSEHGYKYKTLGKGGFSSVLLCESNKYLQDFAIKRVIKHRMTECEYKTMISLSHQNIIQLYDSFNDDYAHYLVMEYCPNGTLSQKGCLSYDKFIFYTKQILESISFCHSIYIAHRDIKPDNILFDQYDHIKLVDFGKDAKSSQKCG